jgi:hypothetical protein
LCIYFNEMSSYFRLTVESYKKFHNLVLQSAYR